MKKYYLSFVFPDIADQICETTQEESDRLQELLAIPTGKTFFWFRTKNNRDLIFNLNFVKAINFSSSLNDIQFKSKSSEDDDILISLNSKREPIREFSDLPGEVYEFFNDLNCSTEILKFASFTDRRGCVHAVNIQEIIIASAPSDLIEEGRRLASG